MGNLTLEGSHGHNSVPTGVLTHLLPLYTTVDYGNWQSSVHANHHVMKLVLHSPGERRIHISSS